MPLLFVKLVYKAIPGGLELGGGGGGGCELGYELGRPPCC